MELDKKFIQTEIDKAAAAIKELKKGVRIHEIMKAAFEEELKKLSPV